MYENESKSICCENRIKIDCPCLRSRHRSDVITIFLEVVSFGLKLNIYSPTGLGFKIGPLLRVIQYLFDLFQFVICSSYKRIHSAEHGELIYLKSSQFSLMNSLAQGEVHITIGFGNSSAEKVMPVKHEDYLRCVSQIICLVYDFDRKVPYYLTVGRVGHLAYSCHLA